MNHAARQAVKELEAVGAKRIEGSRPAIEANWVIGGEKVAWLEYTGRFGVTRAGVRYVSVPPDNVDAGGQKIYSDRANPDSTGSPRGAVVKTVLCPREFISIPAEAECPFCEVIHE